MNAINPSSDKNFDDLAFKFQKKIYGHLKGRIRLAVLKNDLAQFYPIALQPSTLKNGHHAPLRILDAGSGYGPFSLNLARMGHHVTLCDISLKMLEIARQEIESCELESLTNVIHSSIQKLPENENGPYDMVLCHAVLEWIHDPKDLIYHLVDHLKPNGILSLTFYNLNGMIYKNLLRANYKKIIKHDFNGWAGSLTPTYPLEPDQVLTWIAEHPLKVLCHSGMRVFHDYILNLEDKERDPDIVVQLELEYSRKKPYRDLGRYQHILLKKLD
ncbi:MAG: methyltransferase domain-containing protein [Pseudomonadota bacterium]